MRHRVGQGRVASTLGLGFVCVLLLLFLEAFAAIVEP